MKEKTAPGELARGPRRKRAGLSGRGSEGSSGQQIGWSGLSAAQEPQEDTDRASVVLRWERLFLSLALNSLFAMCSGPDGAQTAELRAAVQEQNGTET